MLTRKSWIKLMLAMLATIALAGAGALGLHACFLNQLEVRFQNASEIELPQLAQQLAVSGDEGVAILVRGLTSSRRIVAVNSANSLESEIGRWRSWKSGRSTPRVAFLGSQLAQHVENVHPAVRCDVWRLTIQLLEWPIDRDQVDTTEYLAKCERVIRRVPIAMRRPAETIATEPAMSLTSNDDPEVTLNEPVLEPLLLSPEQHSSPATVEEATQPIALEPTETPSSSELAAPQQILSSPVAADVNVRTLSDQSIPELLADLRASDRPEIEEAIVRELERRNWNATLIAVARRYADSDWRVRRDLAEQLPRTQLDARPWLLLLSRDADPRVRAVAVGILSTGSDPELDRQMREQEANEPNRDVLRVRAAGKRGAEVRN